MIVLTLLKKIFSLFIILICGTLLVKFKIVKSEDSKFLSKLTLYLVMPCSILSAFQVDFSEEIGSGIAFAFIVAGSIHVILLILNAVIKRVFKLNAVEQMSTIYPNAGNLIIPLVTAMLGPEYVIFTTGYIIVQLCLVWSHGMSIMNGEKGINLKKIFTNINMICIIGGAILFIARVRLPGILGDSVSSLASMIGPVSMLCTGLILGGMDLKKLFTNKRVWLITVLRLIVIPLIFLPIMRAVGGSGIVADAKNIALISYLALTSCSASTITQMSQVYGQDEELAGSINIITNLLCVATMPMWIALYML